MGVVLECERFEDREDNGKWYVYTSKSLDQAFIYLYFTNRITPQAQT